MRTVSRLTSHFCESFIAAVIGWIALGLLLGSCGSGEPSKTSGDIVAAEGGVVTLGEDVTARIPAGALAGDGTITITRAAEDNPAPEAFEGGQSLGTAFNIDAGGQKLQKPVTLEIRIDPKSLPEGASQDAVFLAFYDEEAKRWVPVEGRVDQERSVAIVETDHLSWWEPWTWNWPAWIAVLNKILQGNLTDWFNAAALLTNDCPQGGATVSVDSSRANNVVQGCVERDDPVQPGLRVVNPKSFFYEVRPASGGNGYPPQQVLAPGASLPFQANTADPTPLVVSAEITQKSGAYLVVHLIIQMLPGLNQFSFQTQQVACITERLHDVAYVTAAAEALLVEHNGAAASEQLARMLTDADAMRRFITAADDCGYGAARTWSIDGVRQIGAATSTILSATDFTANYFLNYRSELAFAWIQPATPTPTPPPQPESPPTPPTGRSLYADPYGRFSLLFPTGWFVTREESLETAPGELVVIFRSYPVDVAVNDPEQLPPNSVAVGLYVTAQGCRAAPQGATAASLDGIQGWQFIDTSPQIGGGWSHLLNVHADGYCYDVSASYWDEYSPASDESLYLGMIESFDFVGR